MNAPSWAERFHKSVSRSVPSVPRSATSDDTVGNCSSSSSPSLSPSWALVRGVDVVEPAAASERESFGSSFASDQSAVLVEEVEGGEGISSVVEGDLVVVDVQSLPWYQEAQRDLEAYKARMCESDGHIMDMEEEASDYASDGDEEWAPEAVTARKKFEGEMYVKVRWRSHPEATWELEEDFVDQGHQKHITQYLHARCGAPKPAPVRKEREKNTVHLFSVFWPDFVERIRKLFLDSSLTVTQIELLPMRQHHRGFADRVRGGDGMPVMLTHGTNTKNIPGIVASGLVVPTKDGPVRVLNGSAHGVGIYTGRQASLSLGFSRGCGAMFVCAGWVREQVVAIKQVHDTVVFFDAADVVPCFLVSFKQGIHLETPVSVVPYKKVAHRRLPAAAAVRPVVHTGHHFHGESAQRTLRSGMRAESTEAPLSPHRHQAWDSKTGTLTKKSMRTQPRMVKDAYRRGLLTQRTGKK